MLYSTFYLHAIIIDESLLRQRVQRNLYGISFLPLQIAQDKSELVAPVVAHLEARLLIFDVADFDTLQAFVEAEESLAVDFLNGDAL